MPGSSLAIETTPIGLIRPYEGNARTHSKRQIRQIADSILEFGFVSPILIDETNTVIAGHGRLAAAKLLGLRTVPVIRVSGLSDAQKRALRIADNKIAANASWDPELLSQELQALVGTEVDLEITGFATPEIDVMLGAAGDLAPAEDEADEVVEPERTLPSVSRTGDFWLLGDHGLLCGNALESGSYERLLGAERAQAVVADPPYNVAIDGHVCGRGAIRHREFAMASGEMSEAEYTAFLRAIMGHLVRFSDDGSLHYLFMDWRHMFELLAAGRGTYAELKNLCVWSKTNGGMGSLYRSQHELVAVFKNGRAPHVNNVELGKRGRYRTNVWHYPGVNSFRKGRRRDLQDHPTVKPLALMADAILDCSRVNALVLDPVAGSGTTILAAERTNRRAAAIEIDPHYVDVAIRRYEKLSGVSARLEASGASFEEVRAERAASSRERP